MKNSQDCSFFMRFHLVQGRFFSGLVVSELGTFLALLLFES